FWPSPEFARVVHSGRSISKLKLVKMCNRGRVRSLRSAALRRVGALGARGGDEVADLHVAFVAGVFVNAEIVVAHPVETGGPGLGEDDGVLPGELVDDRIGSSHREALGQPGLLANGRIDFGR